MSIFWKILAAGLTAFLLWAAFPPMNEAADIAFALAPMLALARLSMPKTAANLVAVIFLGRLGGSMLMVLSVFHWMFTARPP